MKLLRIRGGRSLQGKIRVSGSKNSAIPCLAAAILASEKVEVKNLPRITDVERMGEILEFLYVKVTYNSSDKSITVDTSSPDYEIPAHLSQLLRGSTLLLGALLAKCGHVRLHQYGGCPIGERPINLHLTAFKKLGAKVQETSSFIDITARKLKGARIDLGFPSVGATENSMLAACGAEGQTIITNVAIEPEICDLIQMLSSMGAKIEIKSNERCIRISGSKEMGGTVHNLIPDRIEAGTYAVAAGITKGCLEIMDVKVLHLRDVLEKLSRMGIKSEFIGTEGIRVFREITPLRPVKITTQVYPGFSTDMQPQFTSLATQASGTSSITETIYENRFHHLIELKKMGAEIRRVDRTVKITGFTPLFGEVVQVKDIRGGSALVLAALGAKGITDIKNAEIIDRGLEDMEAKLSNVGANVEVIDDES